MNWLEATFSLLGLVLLMYAGAKFARDRLGMGHGIVAPDSMKVVGKRMLDRSKSLYVVEIGDRYVLVGAAENSLSLIDRISAEEFAQMTTSTDEPARAPRQFTAPSGSAMLAPGRGLARMIGLRMPGDAPKPKRAGKAAADDAAAPADGTGSGKDGFMTVSESFHYFLGKARSAKASAADDGTIDLDVTMDEPVLAEAAE